MQLSLHGIEMTEPLAMCQRELYGLAVTGFGHETLLKHQYIDLPKAQAHEVDVFC